MLKSVVFASFEATWIPFFLNNINIPFWEYVLYMADSVINWLYFGSERGGGGKMRLRSRITEVCCFVVNFNSSICCFFFEFCKFWSWSGSLCNHTLSAGKFNCFHPKVQVCIRSCLFFLARNAFLKSSFLKRAVSLLLWSYTHSLLRKSQTFHFFDIFFDV